MTTKEIHEMYVERVNRVDSTYEVEPGADKRGLQIRLDTDDCATLIERECPKGFEWLEAACQRDLKPTHIIMPVEEAKRFLDATDPTAPVRARKPEVPAKANAGPNRPDP